ncbi:hypothetical protein [Bradyrhizobium sp. ERR14]|uniref:hypothetical protein n=1 Tax=Bradyrhizobium sp. ERR14 TaxID=2663837 RepID=UPI0016079C40|nr:hypothetical protein [Bradyrhizobium sp. ERR14]MBB4395942.1 hypothetical protein [Bradyrhizobium sp. ERR14]
MGTNEASVARRTGTQTGRKMDIDRAAQFFFPFFFVLTTVLAVLCAFVWFLSPLGFGFAERPTNPLTWKVASTIYSVSYFGGIPALLIGQAVSAILAVFGRTRAAYLVPLLSIASFLLGAGIVSYLLKTP